MASLSGFLITLRQIWGRRVTVEYPEQKRPKSERFHGRHVLNRYPDGMEKCIGCELCAGVCPARCIYVRGADNPADDPVSPGERYGFIYEINYLRCIHCDLCVEACPTEAITETKLFEFSFTNRSDAIYTKDELLVDDSGRARRLPWEHWLGDEDDLTSGWVRATSPNGNAAYEGVVSWSPELGFGTRAPERGQSSGAGAVEPVVHDPAPEQPSTAEAAEVAGESGDADDALSEHEADHPAGGPGGDDVEQAAPDGDPAPPEGDEAR